ncbi:MAG: [Fe-Fe] hydrogenase large subunit C-terminal domain-containing protein [Pseudomonadota bacterium]
MIIEKKERVGYRHSVYIHEAQCTGCLACVLACPAKAMRVRNDKARILSELCVDCGECLRVCPNNAVVPLAMSYKDTIKFKVSAALPTPVLYTQFGDDTYPNEILLALSKLGFDYVFDVALYCEWVNLVKSDWLAKHPHVRTAISANCPALVRLIAKRFPDLIPNILLMEPPREVAAKHVRQMLMKKLGLPSEEIGIFYISPCVAKIEAITRPLYIKHSSFNGAFSIQEVYGDILQALRRLNEEDQETLLFKAGGFGIGWELSGGEAGGLGQEYSSLSVSGLSETLEVLDQVEAGRLEDIRYLECRICQDGCLGGPLTVEDRYRARATSRKLVQMFGTSPRVRAKEIRPLIEQGFFEPSKEVRPILYPLDKDPLKAITKRKKVDKLMEGLPNKRCGACGAPDCRTLAEDVVLGKASLFDCPFYRAGEHPKEEV